MLAVLCFHASIPINFYIMVNKGVRTNGKSMYSMLSRLCQGTVRHCTLGPNNKFALNPFKKRTCYEVYD